MGKSSMHRTSHQTPPVSRRDSKASGEEKRSDKFLLITTAFILRIIAGEYASLFNERVELNSIFYSSEYLKDGVAMMIDGINPWITDYFHFAPLTTFLFGNLHHLAQWTIVPIWALIDIATASNLAKVVRCLTRKESASDLVFILYLYNPISILSAGIASLTVPQNYLCSSILFNFVCGSPVICSFLIGVWSSFTIYPAILLSSLVFRCNGSILRFIMFLLTALLAFCTLGLFNYIICAYSWRFLESVYSPILTFSNIQPNVGLYWYFFVQIFQHFRSFYTISFTVLYFFMPIPITWYIRNDGILHFTINLLFVSIFFPYPTLNQVSVVLAILPLLEEYKKYFRYPLLIAGTIITTIALMPVMWHMWIVGSSGNANFFFATTLCYNIALINIAIELIFAYARRQIDTEYGDLVKKQAKFAFNFF